MAIFAPEYGQPFELIGPNGARAVFNDPSDPDYVGHLSSASGLDSADVRESTENLVEFDGASQGPNYYGARSVVLEGMIPGSGGAAVRNEKVDKLMRASAAMRSDCILKWEPSGGVPVFLTARRSQPLRVEGAWNKTFSLALKAADPRIYSQALYTAHAPVGDPTELTPVNAGFGAAWPVIRVGGGITDPTVSVGSSGMLSLSGVFEEDEVMVADTLRRAVFVGRRALLERTNLYPYPSFEEGSAHGWTGFSTTVVVDPITAAPIPGRGDYALRMSSSSGSKLTSAVYEVNGISENDVVTVGFDYTSALPGAPSVRLEFRDGSNAFLSDQTVTGDPIDAASWRRVSFSAEAPADAANAYVYVSFAKPGFVSAAYYIDGVTIEVEAHETDGAFFDGSHPAAGYSSSWEGTPNASASVMSLEDLALIDSSAPLTPIFDRVNFASTNWPSLAPGLNLVRLLGSSPGEDSGIALDWRSTWL